MGGSGGQAVLPLPLEPVALVVSPEGLTEAVSTLACGLSLCLRHVPCMASIVLCRESLPSLLV